MKDRRAIFVFLRKIGLHPLSAFVAICVDLMLFGPEISVPPLMVLSFIFGFLILIPVFILQKFASGDSAKIAFAKAMIIGILTAIPSPLPSALTGLGVLLGFLGGTISSESEGSDGMGATKFSKSDYINIKAEDLTDKE